MSELLELLLKISNHYSQFTDFLSSSWVFVRLVPVCLVVESTLTYLICKYDRVHSCVSDKQKALATFWKIMLGKLIIFLGLLVLIYINSGEREMQVRALYRMPFYYVYTFGVIVVFVISVVRKNLQFKEQPLLEEKPDGKD